MFRQEVKKVERLRPWALALPRITFIAELILLRISAVFMYLPFGISIQYKNILNIYIISRNKNDRNKNAYFQYNFEHKRQLFNRANIASSFSFFLSKYQRW